MASPSRHRDGLWLLLFWLVGVGLDLLWLRLNTLPPAWDQGDHLSRAFGLLRVLQQAEPWSGGWWHRLWAEAPSYRGPLTGLVSAPVLQLLGPSYNSAVLANSLFQALLMLSLYGQGRLMQGRQMQGRRVGLWAAALSGLAPALLNQRSDVLIDFSLTAVVSACWWLLSWKVLRHPRPGWIWSLLVGVGLGLITLTRATGLLLLWLPLSLLALRLLAQLRRGRWKPLAETLLAAAAALVVAGPWIGQNWLTILTSVNMAHRWGTVYQEGLEATTLQGWLWYPRMLPAMAGALMVTVVLAGGLLAWAPWSRRPLLPRPLLPRPPLPRPQHPWRLIWWLSFPLGALLLATLMTTKNIRFGLPLVPQLLLGLALVLANVRGPWAPPWRFAVVAVGIWGVLSSQFGLSPNTSGFSPRPPSNAGHWPLAEIIGQIRSSSPGQLATVVVVPDSNIHLNPFNLDAEGRRQAFSVAARQSVATAEQMADELAGFDWFLLQGNLPGQPNEALLSSLVRRSPALREVGSWPLPDGGRAQLFHKRLPGLEVEPAACPPDGRPQLRLSGEAAGGLRTTELVAPAALLRQGPLLLAPGADHAIGQGLLRPQGEGCLRVRDTLQISPHASRAAPPEPAASPDVLLLLPDGRPLAVQQLPPLPAPEGEAPLGLPNRIAQLREMGRQLRLGPLDPLFAWLGQINQQDPEQIYLQQGEQLLRARLRQRPDALDDLYSLALAQALQRKADAAAVSLEQLVRLDPHNPRPWLGLGVVNLYRFHPGEARQALDRAAALAPSDPTVHTLRAVAHGMGLDLLGALRLVQHPPVAPAAAPLAPAAPAAPAPAAAPRPAPSPAAASPATPSPAAGTRAAAL
jgi:4-amino-4-deoxy-L-arabinose transferase-like glycosyltransferase